MLKAAELFQKREGYESQSLNRKQKPFKSNRVNKSLETTQFQFDPLENLVNTLITRRKKLVEQNRKIANIQLTRQADINKNGSEDSYSSIL